MSKEAMWSRSLKSLMSSERFKYLTKEDQTNYQLMIGATTTKPWAEDAFYKSTYELLESAISDVEQAFFECVKVQLGSDGPENGLFFTTHEQGWPLILASAQKTKPDFHGKPGAHMIQVEEVIGDNLLVEVLCTQFSIPGLTLAKCIYETGTFARSGKPKLAAQKSETERIRKTREEFYGERYGYFA